ncbi:unnamed protein product [Cuscuta epithymum]|uniref:Uncharacterized protein n=1 Tax=Cuscuta epithymum TaxID=186058 RepID=A0AAV0C4V2_9ASTE|nr:unnamed protein product [Cuscuta epithymum]
MGSAERALFELHGGEEDDDKNNSSGGGGGGDDEKLFVGVPLTAAAAVQSAACSNNQRQISFAHQSHHHHFHYPHNNNQISFGMLHSPPSSSSSHLPPPGNFMSKESSGGAYDLGELDQALFLYLDAQEPSSLQDQRRSDSSGGMRPPTLNIFPSQPMHVEPSSTNNKGNGGLISMETGPGGSKRPSQPSVEMSSNTINDVVTLACASTSEPPKATKTLRRLAQNREAARKSRLRKKAYVQQLESSRIKLTQLEQEIQRARAQGIYFGGGSMLGGEQGLPIMANMSSDAAVFDMEYARWMEEDHRLMCELRSAVQEHLPENELRMYVDNCLAHFDQMINLKAIILKSDVFHLVSGMWKTPAERCFMWMGGFRPSEVLKVIIGQIEPITEQQLIGLCGLQQSTHEAEEALSQGLGALNQSLSDTIASDSLTYPSNMGNYMGQMATAINKLSTLEGFVRQADHLRHQTMHRLHQILTTRQSARCLLAIAEYFHRLRALSALWLARPRPEQ